MKGRILPSIILITIAFILSGFNIPQSGHALDQQMEIEVALKVKDLEKAKELLSIQSAPQYVETAYFDTTDQSYFKDNWIHRVRLADGKLNIVHKKRYLVTGDQEILSQTMRSEAYDVPYRIEKDSSLDKEMYSVTYETDFDTVKSYLDQEEAISLLKFTLPGYDFNDVTLFKHLTYTQYSGYYKEQPIKLESWPYDIVEVSFKTKDSNEAKVLKEELITLLKDNQLLIEEDFSKTDYLFVH